MVCLVCRAPIQYRSDPGKTADVCTSTCDWMHFSYKGAGGKIVTTAKVRQGSSFELKSTCVLGM